MAAEIRRAEPADAATIALLGRITFVETFGHLFHDQADELRAYLDATFGVAKLEDSLANARNHYWLASLRRLPVGFAKLKLPSPQEQYRNAAQLQKIYVLREFLDRGVGRALLYAVMAVAAAHAPLLWLDVLRENARAIRFYARHGFVVSGEDSYAIGAQRFQFHIMQRHMS